VKRKVLIGVLALMICASAFCLTGAADINLSAPAGVSLGVTSGKTLVMRTGTLPTTATTADQVVLTYTVTAGKTLYLEHLTLHSSATAVSATAAILGTASLESPAATKLVTDRFSNPTTGSVQTTSIAYGEPLPIAGGTVIRVVCTPASVTSTTWIANFAGYEK